VSGSKLIYAPVSVTVIKFWLYNVLNVYQNYLFFIFLLTYVSIWCTSLLIVVHNLLIYAQVMVLFPQGQKQSMDGTMQLFGTYICNT